MLIVQVRLKLQRNQDRRLGEAKKWDVTHAQTSQYLAGYMQSLKNNFHLCSLGCSVTLCVGGSLFVTSMFCNFAGTSADRNRRSCVSYLDESDCNHKLSELMDTPYPERCGPYSNKSDHVHKLSELMDCIRMSRTVPVNCRNWRTVSVDRQTVNQRPVSCIGGRVWSCMWAGRTNMKAMQK
jgi:hypothetical protein